MNSCQIDQFCMKRQPAWSVSSRVASSPIWEPSSTSCFLGGTILEKEDESAVRSKNSFEGVRFRSGRFGAFLILGPSAAGLLIWRSRKPEISLFMKCLVLKTALQPVSSSPAAGTPAAGVVPSSRQSCGCGGGGAGRFSMLTSSPTRCSRSSGRLH